MAFGQAVKNAVGAVARAGVTTTATLTTKTPQPYDPSTGEAPPPTTVTKTVQGVVQSLDARLGFPPRFLSTNETIRAGDLEFFLPADQVTDEPDTNAVVKLAGKTYEVARVQRHFAGDTVVAYTLELRR